jgi:hypothetical protein
MTPLKPLCFLSAAGADTAVKTNQTKQMLNAAEFRIAVQLWAI